MLHTYTLIKHVPTKYQLPTPYHLQGIARTRFYRSRSIRQGQRSNQGHKISDLKVTIASLLLGI